MISIRKISLTILLLNVLMLLFAASAVLSLSAAYDPSLSRGSVIALVASVGLYFVVAYAGRPRSMSRLIAGLGVLFAVGVAFLFITQFDYQQYPETPAFIQRIGKATTRLPNLHGPYLHPNGMATLLEMAIPISLALAVSTRRWWLRIVWLLFMLIMLFATVMTFSRGAFIGLAISAVVWGVLFWMMRLSGRGRVILGGLIAVAAVGLIVGLVVVGRRIGPISAAIEAYGTRLELYRNSLYLIRDYAFTGIGLGDTFALVYSRYALLIFVPFLTYTHNLPLAVWFGQGLLGIVSFIGMMIVFYIFIARVIRQTVAGALFYGAWLGVLATLLHGLDDARQYTESPWIMPALFLGMGLAVASGVRALKRLADDRKEAGITPPPRSWRVPIAVTVAAVILVVGGAFVFRDTLRALWYTNLGAQDETRADSFISPDMPDADRATLENSAQDWYQQALAIKPDLANANRRLGNLLVSQGHYEEAVPLLEKAAASESTNPAAIKGLGLAYVWVGRTQEAADTLMRLTNWKDAAQELTTWYTFRKDQGEPLLSTYALETAMLMSGQVDPNLDVWLLVADGYREAGQTERARNWYELVLERDESNQKAKDGLAALGG